MANNSSFIHPPSIVPLCIPNFSKGRQNIESTTPIELSSTTPGVLLFYSLNGRRPDPSETWNLNTATCIQYEKPFTWEACEVLVGARRCNGSGLRTIRALAVDERIVHSSAVVTKTFYVKDVSDPLKVRNRSRTKLSPGSLKSSKRGSPARQSNNDEPRNTEETDNVMLTNNENGNSDKNVVAASPGMPDSDCGDVVDTISEDAKANVESSALIVSDNTNEDPDLIDKDTDRVTQQSLTTVTKKQSNEKCSEAEEEETKRRKRDFGLQCLLTPEYSHKSIQASAHCKQHSDVGNQAVVTVCSRAVQTIPFESERLSVRTKRQETTSMIDSGINHVPPKSQSTSETQTCSTYHHTTDTETQTVRSGDSDRTGRSTTKKTATESRVSPGRGYWRQQMDHIASQLKAEACNNLEFRESIMEQRIAKLSRVSLHEGLDDLVLVLNFGLQRATLNSIGFREDTAA